MKYEIKLPLSFLLFSIPFQMTLAAQAYCPQHHSLIETGMSQQDVVAACGEPDSVVSVNRPITEKIPMTQLIYTTLTPANPYPGLDNIYTLWSLPLVQMTLFIYKLTLLIIKYEQLDLMDRIRMHFQYAEV